MKRKHVDTLQRWSKLKHEQKHSVLTHDEEFSHFIVECILNILSGVIPVDIEQLQQFETELRQLALKTNSFQKKIKILKSNRGNQLLLFISQPCSKILLF